MTPSRLEGGCQRGAVRYACGAPPLQVYVCHCTECRRQSSSAFGISVQVPAAAFSLVRGEPRLWSRPTARGGWLDCWFCPACGSRLWHRGRGDTATLNLKGGSLDRPPDLSSAMHIWTASRMPGVEIPAGVACHPGEPPEAASPDPAA